MWLNANSTDSFTGLRLLVKCAKFNMDLPVNNIGFDDTQSI